MNTARLIVALLTGGLMVVLIGAVLAVLMGWGVEDEDIY